MRIFRGCDEIPFERTVVSVGSYDGVHRGHRLLLRKLDEVARERDAEPLVLTFSPHPKKVLGISDSFLSTTEEELALLEEAGVKNVALIDFTEELSNMESCAFARDILLGRFHAVAAVMGTDHTFGKGGAGRLSSLLDAGIEPVPVELVDNIGSTEIRSLVRSGNIERAVTLLGGGYLISTPVTDSAKLLPPKGRYMATVDGVETEVMVPGLPQNRMVKILKKIEK